MEYTLEELVTVIKEGEFYRPLKRHRLLKRVYLEGDHLQFELYSNVPHVGLGIRKNEKFIKIN